MVPLKKNLSSALHSSDTPVWDAKFETPLLARTMPPTDHEGKLDWTNMNTVERLNLLPSLNGVNIIDILKLEYLALLNAPFSCP